MRDAGWMQQPLFAPPIKWVATPVHLLPDWPTDVSARVAVDVETRDDDLYTLGTGTRRGGYMVGISFAIEDGPAHYMPFAHEGGGNLDRDAVIAYMQRQAVRFRGTIIGANLQYDLDYLWEAGIYFINAVRHADIQISECLLDELQDSYSLDAILARRGLPGKDERELIDQAKAWGVDPKKGLWRLPAGAVGAYAIGDVRQLAPLLRRQEKEIDEQKLDGPWDTECKVLLALLRMTRRGFRVNMSRLEEISRMAQSAVADELGRVKYLTGVAAGSPMNANHLAPAFAALGIQVPITPEGISEKTGKPTGGDFSITNDWLDVVEKDPAVGDKAKQLAHAIKRARDYYKLDRTYCVGVRKHVVGDRLHPSFKQMRGAEEGDDDDDSGARFGRMASKHPNAQAQPVRNKEYGKKWRGIYIPEHGCKWVKGDYSQQEPRTTVHYAELCELPGAKEFADNYRNDPLMDSHSMFSQMSGLPRGDAKQVFLGLCYGMGGGLLAQELGLPTEVKHRKDGRSYLGAGPQAQSVMDQFDARVPFVRGLARMCTRKAERAGFLLLIDGRRVRFPRDKHGNFDWTYKALNRLIQGSAAVQTKFALIALDKEGLDPRLTVHDEFDFSMSDMADARKARDIMRDALPLRVPSRVDFDAGKSYGELEPLEFAA